MSFEISRPTLEMQVVVCMVILDGFPSLSAHPELEYSDVVRHESLTRDIAINLRMFLTIKYGMLQIDLGQGNCRVRKRDCRHVAQGLCYQCPAVPWNLFLRCKNLTLSLPYA